MARSSLNKVQLIGNLADNPTTRATQNGVTVCNFRVITNEGYKDANGNWVDRPEGHNIVTFDKLGDICDRYLVKGKKVYIEGSLQTRSYEKDGITRYITEIKASDMLMLDRAGDQSQSTGNNYNSGSSNYNSGNSYQNRAQQPAPAPVAAPSGDAFGPQDDLPF